MPQIEIDFPNVHPRVGELLLPHDPGTHPIRPAADFAPQSYGVIISWPRRYSPWFRAYAEAESSGTVAPFGSRPMDLKGTVVKHGCEDTPLAQVVIDEDWVDANEFLVGSASALASIRLRIAVDTNSEPCIRELLTSLDGLVPSIELTAVFFDSEARQPDDLTILLNLGPATPTSKSARLLGVDIGNTSSTVAIVEPLEIDGDPTRPLTRRIPMLTSRPVPIPPGSTWIGQADVRGTPIPSELRFVKFHSGADGGSEVPRNRRFPDGALYPDDDLPHSAEYNLGELARAQGVPARSVVMGAKRMGSARPQTPRTLRESPRFATYPIHALHRITPASGEPSESAATISLDARAPLELLACRLLQHFREAQRAWPAKIALTYPTTYTRFELQSLRRAVQKGWLRMQAIGQRPGAELPSHDQELSGIARALQQAVSGSFGLEAQSRDPVIRLLLDEASAASFFFIYRKIFEEMTGGLAAFHYLYEQHGLNMLLYDCGGGTTDIALVNVKVEADLRKLRINVLRRSGDRTFGGDNITRQVCRLLKAKLQHLMITERRRGADLPLLPAPPAKPPADKREWRKLAGELEAFIVAMGDADANDALVPSRTLPNQHPTEDRRAVALALWRLGELLKHNLSAEVKTPDGKAVPVSEVRLPSFDRQANKLTESLLGGLPGDQQIAQFKKKLEAVTLTRVEIDALIYEPMMKGIRNCNTLIREEFENHFSEESAPKEVQWVVVSGNAVRYPFLQQSLRRNLAVSFLDDEQRFTFDPTNAKDATAKGAALALATMEGAAEIEVCFDSGLADRLPFSVGCQTKSIGAVRRLFEEHSRYQELQQREPIPIPVAELSPNQIESKRFILQRRFPGDDGYQNFLAFEFPDGIQGPHLSVRYDDTSEFEFRVTDGKGTEGLAVDQTAGDLYVAPAQRGDI